MKLTGAVVDTFRELRGEARAKALRTGLYDKLDLPRVGQAQDCDEESEPPGQEHPTHADDKEH